MLQCIFLFLSLLATWTSHSHAWRLRLHGSTHEQRSSLNMAAGSLQMMSGAIGVAAAKKVATLGHPLISEVLQHFEPPSKDDSDKGILLDVGCSDGRLTRRLAELPGVAQITALDMDSEVVEEARFLSSRANDAMTNSTISPPDVVFVKGRATDTELFRIFSGGVNYLTCFQMLHWLKEPDNAKEIAILNFARALAPGGQMFMLHFLGLDQAFLGLEAEVAGNFLNVQFEKPADNSLLGYVSMQQRLAQFSGLFKAAGLTVEFVRVGDDRFDITPSQLPEFFYEASQFKERVPEETRAEYLVRWSEETLRHGHISKKGKSYDIGAFVLLACLRKDKSASDEFYDSLIQRCEAGLLRFSSFDVSGDDSG